MKKTAFTLIIILLLNIQNIIFANASQDAQKDTSQFQLFSKFDIGTDFINTNLFTNPYAINDAFSSYFACKIGIDLGLNIRMDSIYDNSFFEGLGVYSSLGLEYLSGSQEKLLKAGWHNQNGSLEEVELLNRLESNFLISNLRAGVSKELILPSLHLYTGFGIGYILNSNMEVSTKLQNESIEIIDPKGSSDYKDNISSLSYFWEFGASYGIGKYKFSDNTSIDVSASLSALIGLNNLLTVKDIDSQSLHLNGISLGIKIGYNFYGDTIIPPPSPPDTFLTINYNVHNHDIDSLTNSIYAKEIIKYPIFVYHPKIYLENNFDDFPGSLKILSIAERLVYKEKMQQQNLIVKKYDEFYNDMLNVLAYYLLSNPKDKIRIDYPKKHNNPKDLQREIEFISNYLQDDWSIGGKRITHSSVNLPSNTIQISGIKEYLFEYPVYREFNVNSSIDFHISFPPNISVRNWKLRVQHFVDGIIYPVAESSGTGKDSIIKFHFNNRNDVVLSNSNNIEYVYELTYTNGKQERKIGHCPISFNNADKKTTCVELLFSDARIATGELKKLLSNTREIKIIASTKKIADETSNILGLASYHFIEQRISSEHFQDLIRIEYIP